MALGFWLQADMYLSNEVKKEFGLGATKLSEVKVGGRQKNLPTRPGSIRCAQGRPSQ